MTQLSFTVKPYSKASLAIDALRHGPQSTKALAHAMGVDLRFVTGSISHQLNAGQIIRLRHASGDLYLAIAELDYDVDQFEEIDPPASVRDRRPLSKPSPFKPSAEAYFAANPFGLKPARIA